VLRRPRRSGRSVPDISAGEVVLRVVLAAVLGGAIGAEREIREREAGLRTHLLVSVGAALFTLVSAYAWTDFAFSLQSGVTLDPTRISAQIVTGIGFLGAGAIIRQGLSIRGLTTAATLWVVAAIGLASGAGYYWAAVVTTALVLVTLWPLRIAAHRLVPRMRPGEPRLFVELAIGGGAAPILEVLESLDVRISSFSVVDDRDGRHVALEVVLPEERRETVVPALARLDDVTGVRWSE
jgi:putative Mg2+ transporter-C (MgtC) family protein